MQTNPFLDPDKYPKGGRIASPGQSLSRLDIPEVNTLIYKTTETRGRLFMIDVSEAFRQQPKVSEEPIKTEQKEIGFQLNLNLLGMNEPETLSEINPTEIGKQTTRRPLPTNFREVRDVLHLITGQRTSRRTDPQNAPFDLNELREIAHRLHLPAGGNKSVLANRIRTHIQKNLPPENES